MADPILVSAFAKRPPGYIEIGMDLAVMLRLRFAKLSRDLHQPMVTDN
ncbi:hypothetical protein V1286_005128 [Bradyrhizobium algeriense]|uniref:Uncharacterized protein n=1 Tax=Bradyrhizobium algeriense TaxID=634784 RepID=A0ABU8BGD1_9BRAD